MSSMNLEGQILGGRYQIQSLIGQGGMASVYKAFDPNLHRAVAIKVIHPHLSNNPEFFRRFEEEATAVAHLRHPNIVQMYDFNHEGDLYFMVMEFVMGETLQTRLKRLNASRRRLSVKEVITFTAEICDAAYYAHQRGMIHRDIKPANIMLDVNGRAILMDFGIARMVGGSQHTATGAILGTAMYMSPEQIQGLHADARADIYSIGIMMYEMLSGKPPFEADSAMTLMMMHLNDPVPDLLELQPNTPPDLIDITNKALAKDRDERYQTAKEMADSLRKLQEQSHKIPVAATHPSLAPQVTPEMTVVDTATVKDTGETVIETPVPAHPVIEPSKPLPTILKPAADQDQFQPTLTEQAVQPVLPTSTLMEHAVHPVQPTPTLVEQAAQPVQTTTIVTEEPAERIPIEGKRSKVWLPVLIVLVILIVGGGGYFTYLKLFANGGMNSPSPSATAGSIALLPESATQTAALPATSTVQPTSAETKRAPITATFTVTFTAPPTATETEIPSLTPSLVITSTPPPVVTGGADKIAFLSGKNVWVANLDGSDLTQLTKNGTIKTYLRWLPNGQGLTYISGKCIESVTLTGEISQIACYNNADKLEGFEVSPDRKNVVIGLDSQVYLVPFELDKLATTYSHDSLSAIATCANMAPYTHFSAHFARWSKDSKKWALVAQIPLNGVRADIVAVLPVDRCYIDIYPATEVQFPPPHFTYSGYTNNPYIQDLAFDGNSLFVMHGITRNDGFGDLHIFNMETFKFNERVNPINNTCCYRDAEFSPDGSYLAFAFQDISLGQASTTKLYYIPFGSIGTGEVYDPLPLPDITDPRERPQPVLRPATP